MTLDQEPLDQDIIDALRTEARAPAPAELEHRVATRLAAGAGILGLTTSLAGATQAAVVTSAAAASVTAGGVTAVATMGAAGAPAVSGAAGTLTLLGLTKTLLVGMGLGAGTGLGLYTSFRSSVPVASVSSPARVVTAPAVAPPSRSERMAPALPAPTAEPEAATMAVPGTPSNVVHGTASAPSEIRMNPGPELPQEATRDAAKSLAEQQALLDDARAALRRGDGQAALAAVRQHRERFATTSFDEEREAVAIKALVLVGRNDDARARFVVFARRFPASLLAPSLRAALGLATPKESVTERVPARQTQGRE